MKKICFTFENVKVNDIIDIPKHHIDFESITCVLGPSGAGKTTFLRLLNKLISPDQGVLTYNDKNLEEIDTILHRREVVMLSQKPVMFEGSIQHNFEIGCRFSKQEIPDLKMCELMMEKLQLDKKLRDDAQQCSIGEKQRIALGRVLFMNPQVYLMDEPSSALDKSTEKLIIKLIVEHTKNNHKTLVMVTHNNDLANDIADQVITIEKSGNHG